MVHVSSTSTLSRRVASSMRSARPSFAVGNNAVAVQPPPPPVAPPVAQNGISAADNQSAGDALKAGLNGKPGLIIFRIKIYFYLLTIRKRELDLFAVAWYRNCPRSFAGPIDIRTVGVHARQF